MNRTRILVVDDEVGIVRLCERILHRAGYEVFAFVESPAAAEFLRRERVDLLLVDIRMPVLNGFDLIAEARQRQPDLAILIMTGFGTMEMAVQALRQGVDGILLKPFEKGEELIGAVRQALADSQRKRDVARMQALRPLFDITEMLLAETNLPRLLDLIMTAVCGHLRCECAAFYRYSPETNTLERVVQRGKEFVLQEASGLESGLIGRTDALGAPLWVSVPEEMGDADLRLALGESGLDHAMTAPIVRQKVRGVLFAGRGRGAVPFREADLEMFILLARQAGVAMENASLYEELRQYVRQVEESQQALVRAEKLATAGRMTASIAHEINNPLQAVQNCLHLAQRPELGEAKRQEYLALAEAELERLRKTVQRMLEFYRPGSLERQQVMVDELLRQVLALMSPQLEQRGIRVTTGFSSRLPPVIAVRSQLEQVFINLIVNAYDAMPEGGELRITARPVRSMVEIIFRDTGPGIPPEDRLRIFEPFFSTKPQGTGLGLSVSYGIIAAHGGNLDLLPERGKGAAFRILLPAKGERG